MDANGWEQPPQGKITFLHDLFTRYDYIANYVHDLVILLKPLSSLTDDLAQVLDLMQNVTSLTVGGQEYNATIPIPIIDIIQSQTLRTLHLINPPFLAQILASVNANLDNLILQNIATEVVQSRPTIASFKARPPGPMEIQCLPDPKSLKIVHSFCAGAPQATVVRFARLEVYRIELGRLCFCNPYHISREVLAKVKSLRSFHLRGTIIQSLSLADL